MSTVIASDGCTEMTEIDGPDDKRQPAVKKTKVQRYKFDKIEERGVIFDNFKNYGCGLQRIKWKKIRDIGGGPQDRPMSLSGPRVAAS